MSTKAYQEGVTGRISALIKEAGGQTAFARHVWADNPLAHKGKVRKWYKGLSGIHPAEAIKVAEKFKRRPAWLLLGEPPERVGVGRTDVELSDDLAAYLKLEALSSDVVPQRWLRDTLADLLDGRELLTDLGRLVSGELRQAAALLNARSDATVELRRIYKGPKTIPPFMYEALGKPTAGNFVRLKAKTWQTLAMHILEEEGRRKTRKRTNKGARRGTLEAQSETTGLKRKRRNAS